MSSINNTFQFENELNKSKSSGFINTIQKLDALNSGKQELKTTLRDITGPIQFGLESVVALHAAENVDMIPEIFGDSGANGAMLVAAGKPLNRQARSNATVTLSANGPYPPNTKSSGLSVDDKVTYDALSILTGRKKAILDFIISGQKLTALDMKKCNIIDNITTFKNKYTIKKEAPVAPAPVTQETPVAPVTQDTPVAPVTQETPVAPVTQDTPVAPVTQETPVAPVTQETPVAPVAPAAPVTSAPVAPAPVAPITPVAPAPVAPAPVAPIAATQQTETIQSWGEDPPPTSKKRGRPKATPAAPAVV